MFGHLPVRRIFYGVALTSVVGIALAEQFFPGARWAYVPVLPLIALGIMDIRQTRHAVKRNFPIIGHLRYLLEMIRPEINQYFVESDIDGRPFDRQKRSNIYQRAKRDLNTHPFGTQKNVYQTGYAWINHSIHPVSATQVSSRVTVGGPHCHHPYLASLFNVSAMSYGALSKNAVLALNTGAKAGGFAHNTGEGGLSPYHLEPGGDLIWQIGTGYFSCRKPDGTFNPETFAENAQRPQVKMIELKLSQGAKPGHGGILPKQKITPEIAAIRHVPMGKDVLSPPAHSAFNTPVGLIQFISQLRELSGGKPVGFKLCVGNKHEFIAIAKAMIDTGITPDFITVDGGEGGTGAAPLEFSDSVGMPLEDGLVFVHQTLVGFGLRDHIKVIASGKITTGFDIVEKLALGADLCNSARGMMFALGCIQALQCHANTCPTGIATQNPDLVKGLDIEHKWRRVQNFHAATIHNLIEIVGAAGLYHPCDIHPGLIQRRISHTQVISFADLHPGIPTGCLREETTVPPSWQATWHQADANTFYPAAPKAVAAV